LVVNAIVIGITAICFEIIWYYVIDPLLDRLPRNSGFVKPRSRHIAATPCLNNRDWNSFLIKIRDGLKNPVGFVPTPRLEGIRGKIIKDAQAKRRQ